MSKNKNKEIERLTNEELQFLELEADFNLLRIRTERNRRERQQYGYVHECSTANGKEPEERSATVKKVLLGTDSAGEAIYKGKTVSLLTKTKSETATILQCERSSSNRQRPSWMDYFRNNKERQNKSAFNKKTRKFKSDWIS